MRQRLARTGWWFNPVDFACFITLLVALLIALNISEWLRGGFGWRWNYEAVPAMRLLPLILTSIVYMLGAWFLIRRTQRAAPVLVWSMIGSVALAWAGTAARNPDAGYELFARTASLSTGQQWMAAQVDWVNGEWHSWAQVMTRLGGHVSNIPPGAPMIYALASDMLDRIPALAVPLQYGLLSYQCSNYDLLTYSPGLWASSLLGMLMPLWAAFTVLPLYALAKRFLGSEARYTALWWGLIPAVIVFAGSWSTLYPLFSVVTFLLIVLGLEKRRALLILMSGIAFGTSVFINFALIPLALLIGVYMLGYILLVQRRGVVQAVIAGLWFSVGMAIPWGIYWLVSGETFFDLLSASMQFHLNLDRPYLFWVGMHLWDWLLWTGVGFGVLGIIYLWRVRRVFPTTAFTMLAGSLALSMLVLIVSGTARGETGRVWLFFSPFLLIVGAGALRQMGTAQPRYEWMTAAQAIYAVAIVASLNAMTTNFTPPPNTPQVNVSRVTDATFSDGMKPLFRLVGWDAETDGESINLRLSWEGLSQSNIPYWFGAVLVSPDGAVYGRSPWQPGGEEPYPTTCWATQTQVGDTLRLELPAGAVPGDWWISLAAYPDDAANGQLAVSQPGQAHDKQVGLGPIRVPMHIVDETH